MTEFDKIKEDMEEWQNSFPGNKERRKSFRNLSDVEIQRLYTPNDIKDLNRTTNIPWALLDRIKKIAQWFFKDKFDKNFDSLMPAYGHGQAIEYPDLPYLIWSYKYDYSDEFSDSYKFSGELDNRERYHRAFTKIKEHMDTYLKNYPHYKDEDITFDDFEELFKTLLAKKTDKGRIKNWRKVMIRNNLFSENDAALDYEKTAWLQEAFSNFDKKRFEKRKVEGVKLTTTFVNSSWYKYYLAVKWYKEQFFKQCASINLAISR